MKKAFRFVVIFLSLILTFVIILSGCGLKKAVKEYSKVIFAMDTVMEFKVFGDDKAKEALEQAIERVREIEDRMSATKEGSDVVNINQNAGKKPVKVHDDTFYVVEKALEYGQLTDGDFDITIRPIVELWGIMSDNPRIPKEEEIQEKLDLVDYRKVKLDKKSKTVYLEKEGMGIDLGAITKGYTADEVTRILKKAGVKHALINLGGNVFVIGNKPDGSLWRIGIQDPRSEETGETHIAVLDVEDLTIVSSGDYERYMVDVYKDTGVRYHHIFDPKTGVPARSGLIACTIVAKSSIDADALSTSLFIMGKDEGFRFIEEMSDVEAIAITEDKEIYITEGLKDKFRISGENYKLR